MQFKGIKRGKTIELLEEINIPDGTEIIIDEFNILVSGKSGFWKALEKFRQETDLKEVGIDPEIFERVRDL